MNEPTAPRRVKQLIVLAAILVLLAGCGGSAAAPPSSAELVALAAGATNCDDSGYSLVNRMTGDQEEIYDCAFQEGNSLPHAKCVTYANGVANDSTVAVRLAFSTALGTAKPSCLST